MTSRNPHRSLWSKDKNSIFSREIYEIDYGSEDEAHAASRSREDDIDKKKYDIVGQNGRYLWFTDFKPERQEYITKEGLLYLRISTPYASIMEHMSIIWEMEELGYYLEVEWEISDRQILLGFRG